MLQSQKAKDILILPCQRRVSQHHYSAIDADWLFYALKVSATVTVSIIAPSCLTITHYSSSLARILQEQIRPQLGMSYGDIKNPDCKGIPVNWLSEVDWDKVSLDEWIAILKITNRLPTAGNALEKLNLDKLTGQGSHFNIDGSRTNTLDRNVQRLAPLDVQGIRQQTESQGWSLGPKP